MLKVASHYPLERMAQLAQSPRVLAVAKFKAPDWKNKEEVKAFQAIKNRVSRAKFRWNPEERIWSKEIHKILIDEGKIHFDFDWDILRELPP